MIVRATRRQRQRQGTYLNRWIVTAIFLCLSTQKIGYQDALSLIAEEIAPGDRWQVRLTVGSADSEIGTPSASKATIGASTASARTPPRTATMPGSTLDQPGRTNTLAPVNPRTTGSIAIASAAVNRANKSDLLIRQPAPRNGFYAGLLHTITLFGPAEVDPKGPRMAFVLPPPPNAALTKAEVDASTKDVKGPEASADESAKPVALAYAAPDDKSASDAPFNAVIAKPGTVVLDPNVKATHAWVNNAIPKSAHSRAQMKCLADAIYFEARGEPELGQIAVAQVVLNRLKNPAYPDTICGVVYQNKNRRNRCQFSFACDGIRERITDKGAWAKAQDLAKRVMDDEKTLYIEDVGPATHYHATYVRPRWARHMTKKEKIGHHIFYQTYNGGWS